MNIWDCDGWKIITTNGNIKKNGEAVMGAGLALQAKQRYPDLPKKLAKKIQLNGNQLFVFSKEVIVTFPTKHNYWEKSDIDLIEKSTIKLAEFVIDIKEYGFDGWPDKVYMPRVGCLNGQLDWSDVKPILEKHLGEYIKSGQVVFTEP